MKIRMVVIVGEATLLLVAAVAVVVASHNHQQPAPPPDVPVAASPAEVRVKALERKPEPMDHEVVDASSAVAIVCGADSATADRYEARNDALRSIARRRDMPEKDVAALIAYLRTADNAMRVERVAALKNDVMNLLRSQEPPPKGLAETLMGMIDGNRGNCEDMSLGCGKAASALQQGRGRPCHIGRDSTTHNSSTPNSPTHTHPPRRY